MLDGRMLTSSFQIAPGLGPRRERQLWQAGVVDWGDYPAAAATVRLPARQDVDLRCALERADAALVAQDVAGLAELLPGGEHWRLFERFGGDAAYLDIETSDDTVESCFISAIGVLDRRGPQLLLAGRDLQRFPELAREWSVLVTFNGSAFDVPILRRAFPEWQPPLAHIDLRHVLRRLGQTGGLKAIERRLHRLHLERPEHLRGFDGSNACGLFQRWRTGDRAALRLFAEYNLYDVIHLRTLAAYAYNELSAAEAARAPALRPRLRPLAVPGRGDVLYDVSKILLAL
ncbi:MAG: hypothetical protein RL033_965 [Pseudomonadota bacterium]